MRNCCGIFKAVKSCLVCCDTKSHNCFWVAVGLKTIRRGWSVGLLWSTLITAEVKRETESKNTEPTRIFDMHRAQWNATGAWMCISSQQSAHRTAVTSAGAHDDLSLGWNSVSRCWVMCLSVIRHRKLQKSFFLQLYHHQFHHYTVSRTLLTMCDGQVADTVNMMIFTVLCAGPDKVVV